MNKWKGTHVDQFVKYGLNKKDPNEVHARWVLFHFRAEPLIKTAFHEMIKLQTLFCTYKEKKYKVVGATWSGKIWLSSDYNAEFGYELAVFVDDCSDWKKEL